MTNTSHVEERIDHLVKELAGKRRDNIAGHQPFFVSWFNFDCLALRVLWLRLFHA